jgi:hypothetical protein
VWATSGAGEEQVSYGIDGSSEAEGPETLAKPDGTSLLGKGRRRNGGDGELEVGNVPLMARKPLEETMDTRVGSEAHEILGERTGLRTLGLRSYPGTEWHFRNDILCFQLLWNHNDTVLRCYFGSHSGKTASGPQFLRKLPSAGLLRGFPGSYATRLRLAVMFAS